jgi:hypothetical protein
MFPRRQKHSNQTELEQDVSGHQVGKGQEQNISVSKARVVSRKRKQCKFVEKVEKRLRQGRGRSDKRKI